MSRKRRAIADTAAEAPDLKQIVETTYKHAEERLRRETEERIAAEYLAEHKIEIVTDKLLRRAAELIESAAGYGRTTVAFEVEAFEVEAFEGSSIGRVSATEGREIVTALKNALRDFNPDIYFYEPDAAALDSLARSAEYDESRYARSAVMRVGFRGFRLKFDWLDHLKRRANG